MAKSIMIQGTMSNAGKSLLVTGLCRIFRQDGFHPAPFKSQNMALNSYITPDGLEIGRAQAVQAEACGIPCSADMNPILLKPSSETGSQVIVNGIPRGNMSAREYFSYKTKLIPDILAAYRRLSRDHDILVIEGAGSPAEINLRDHDIVNMGLAEMTDSPVFLAGDIDRGGVFAQLYGTVMLLSEPERKRIRGLIINKFRGDPSLLDSGIDILEKKTGIPVIGTIPYLDVDIDDEDSLSRRLDRKQKPDENVPDTAVIRFPRISNFTDFHALELAGFGVRYVSRPEDFGSPDLVILPGTKNTIEDYLWMAECGIADQVYRHAKAGKPVFGICGGYQMLGEILDDRDGTEGGQKGRVLRGLSLLPVRTHFTAEKCRRETAGVFADTGGMFRELAGLTVNGYEVHMGVTEPVSGKVSPLLYLAGDETPRRDDSTPGDRRADGAVSGSVAGTYLHGIFDAPGVADALMKSLGFQPAGKSSDYAAYREEQYDRLADGIRKNLDMKAVYAAMGMEDR